MKKTSLLILGALMFLAGSNTLAQVVEDEQDNSAYDSFYESENNNKARKPFVYPFVRDADVVWKQKVWRLVDFREKMNQSFYFPRPGDEAEYGLQGRANLFSVIDKALRNGEIKCYEDDEFKKELNYVEFYKTMGTTQTVTNYVTDADGYDIEVDSTIYSEMNPEDVKRMRIKEQWYVDKQRSVRDVRIIGFAFEYDRPNPTGEGTSVIPLGWIRYNDPAVRNLLANAEMYNPKNDAKQISYDDVFVKRLFTSFITRTSNQQNRRIADYLTGLDALLASDEIEEDIFNREQDMWEY
ncbi:MAG: gliding motility protein GldN [Bacteroidales bacterium]